MTPKLQIKEILALPDKELEELLDNDIKGLLDHLVPVVRTPNKAHVEDANKQMIEKLSKLFNI